ncbi:ROK family transcriptional regulator [Cognatiyoonia sp. IB215182]|uniref:ROK family transcriptional regulator n=1 Tax=Cognatiyoonia sp. IB215182 TaxID=3097353 RepID=UPI002A0CC861|nr:ROK family transcriptional regulator [Cognatiyoonia sp. IB215182]MDX8354029.1 ROK family transcriptional regulator [Cognatiyoonia sp. IB215182]
MSITTETVGANAERARSHNRQMVLDRVRQAGQIGRAEIARGSGLSTQAVSNIISDLLSDGLISEQGRKATTRGQPPVQYGLNPVGGYAVGIEIRPDAIFATVLDLCGKPVASLRRTLAVHDLNGVTEAVVAAKSAIIEEADLPASKVLGVGIVMPGPFGRTGLSGTGSELSIFHEVSPTDWFTEALNTPVVVENDANAAAVAELVAGAARGLDTFACLYFGNGLGLGLIQDGRLVRGAFGNAGEIGHIPVTSKGRAVPLEAALSRLAVQKHLANAGFDIRSSDGLAEAYAARNAALMTWLDAAAAEPLSHAITIIENMFDPEAVILGGAMPDAIFDHLISSVTLAERSVSNRPGRTTDRLLRGASGRMTGTLGAGALVINRAFTPRIAAVAR